MDKMVTPKKEDIDGNVGLNGCMWTFDIMKKVAIGAFVVLCVAVSQHAFRGFLDAHLICLLAYVFILQ